ncbi:MAG: hypothetical protein U9Q07_09980 [Planctomycetota bacterium]|nr:hypothetical protein [Planctomycetota bacterium]
MKVLFAGRSVYHFTYYESLIRRLCTAGHSVEMVYDKKWSHGQSDESLRKCLDEYENLVLSWGLRRSDKHRRLIFNTREIRSYTNYLRRALSDGQSQFYLNRWRSYLTPLIRFNADKWPLRWLLAREKTQVFLEKIEAWVPPDKQIVRSLQEKEPDVVIASPVDMRFSEEVEYVKAAKSIGIPTVALVLSWDNLTTKGLFAVVPDLMLVWNDVHLSEAVSIHKVPASDAVIVGSTFFDKWFDADHLLMSREHLCRRLGIDPGRPFITYLGSSANIARDESWLVERIIAGIRSHPDEKIRQLGIVVRPHPANAKIYERIDADGVVVWPKNGALPESETSQKEFFSTLTHCVGTIGINTSGMIDAIVLDKPCVSAVTEEYQDTQSGAAHFKHLVSSDAVELAQGVDESLKSIETMLSGDDNRKEARKRFVHSFVWPYGNKISAASVAARVIELAARKIAPEEVKLKIQHEFSETK